MSSPPPAEKSSGLGPSPILPAVRYALRREDRTQHPHPLHATTILKQGAGAVPHAGSERISDRASGPRDASGGRTKLVGVLDLEILHDSPEKADEFTGGGNGGDLGWFLGVDAVEELEETVLSPPGMSDDAGWA